MNDLKATFTQYWPYMALRAGCQLNLFDALGAGPQSSGQLAQALNAHAPSLEQLLHALAQQGTVQQQNSQWQLTPTGAQLTTQHPQSLKEACLLWGDEHLQAWLHLQHSIRTGQPAFEHLYGMPFFDYLAQDPAKLANYHKAMYAYALADYEGLHKHHNFEHHKHLLDAGGGMGALLQQLAPQLPGTQCTLLDRPEVLQLIEHPQRMPYALQPGNLFEPLPQADGILLSRVLHDWPDPACHNILQNCYQALPANGYLYILENMADTLPDGGHLLSLNMLVMCQSHERTKAQYQHLATQNGFALQQSTSINTLQTLLIFQKA